LKTVIFLALMRIRENRVGLPQLLMPKRGTFRRVLPQRLEVGSAQVSVIDFRMNVEQSIQFIGHPA
jgi:hypothetical protein